MTDHRTHTPADAAAYARATAPERGDDTPTRAELTAAEHTDPPRTSGCRFDPCPLWGPVDVAAAHMGEHFESKGNHDAA